MKLGKQPIPIATLIRRNWLDTEMRVVLNQLKIDQYATEMKDGAVFPPPVVFIDHEELLRVGDGFHRILAEKKIGRNVIAVDLRRGGRREAFVHGIEVNRQQKGLPFSLGDLEKCILTLLKDEETRKWTQTKIAETVGCSIAYVSQVVGVFRDAIERPDTIIDRNGVVRSRQQPKDKETVGKRREKVLEMFADGVPKIEIARKVGVARFAVQRYIAEALKEKILKKCPHCNGSGFVES